KRKRALLAPDRRDRLVEEVLVLEGRAALRRDQHDRRRPFGESRIAKILLRGHVDVGHVLLLAQNGQVGDDVDGRDVAREDAHALRALPQALHHLLDAPSQSFALTGLLHELVQLFGQLLVGERRRDRAQCLEALLVRLGRRSLVVVVGLLLLARLGLRLALGLALAHGRCAASLVNSSGS
ncbi:unnamed protein product, partial [Pelagomonas calceolata]